MAQHNEVKLHFLDYWRVVRIRWVLILLSFFLVLLTAAVVTYFQPREYQSSSSSRSDRRPRIRASGGLETPAMPIHDPQLAPTVFQVIKRTGILYPVIEDLKLQEKWSQKGESLTREQCFVLLRNRVQVEEIRNTDLLQISVFDTRSASGRRHRQQDRQRFIRTPVSKKKKT